MSKELDRALVSIDNAKYKRALRDLWVVEADCRGANIELARQLHEAAVAVRESVSGRTRQDCDHLIGQVQSSIRGMELAQQPGVLTNPAQGALAVIGDCHVLGGSGVVFSAGETLSLIFRDDELLVRSVGGREQLIAYDAISALEIGGPGVQRSGGGFYGGGFGLSGAVEGMLVASALNMLTTRTKVTTVICVQTAQAELFVRHTNLTPNGLRIHLSPVFVSLRGRPHQTSGPPQLVAAPQADDVISQLEKLSALLDRGVIDRTEFDRLKDQAIGESNAGKP